MKVPILVLRQAPGLDNLLFRELTALEDSLTNLELDLSPFGAREESAAHSGASENWNRPDDEVSGLMGLVMTAVAKYLARMAEDGVRIRIIGDRSRVADKVRDAWDHAEQLTANNRKITVSVAFNYGGRWDILQACRKAIADGVAPQDLDETRLSRYMSLSYAPDPDLFIRTGGELRISNFLLWQSAHTEFHFTDCLWPDFDARALDLAIEDYARRDRRFGQVKVDLSGPSESGTAVGR